MTPELQALGKRATACKGFRWMAGMLDSTGRRVSWIMEEHALAGGIRDGDHRVRPGNCAVHAGAVPDFDDPATRGCLLELAREACGDPNMHVEWTGDGAMWVVVHAIPPAGLPGNGASEIEALVVALEAAP